MGLLSGSVSCTRFNVLSVPEAVDFTAVPFHGIQPGSERRESVGIVPYELEEPFEIGASQWGFRVRFDRLRVDSTLLKERCRELIKLESQQVGYPSRSKIKALKMLAEEELLAESKPVTQIIECFMDRSTLLVGSTAKRSLGTLCAELKKCGVEVAPKTPWLDAGQEEEGESFVDPKDPVQSVLGCRFLRSLLDDPEVFLEGHRGHVKLATRDGGEVVIKGAVGPDLDKHFAEDSEILAAKLVLDKLTFTLDALSFQIKGLRMPSLRSEHWSELLKARVEPIQELWTYLDEKYHQIQQGHAQS